MRRRNKFGVRIDKAGKEARTVDGILFASQAEANRYSTLKLLQRRGLISALELQPRYDIQIAGRSIGFYKADFRYYDIERGEGTVEDVKGKRTELYVFKKKCVEALYDITITEMRA